MLEEKNLENLGHFLRTERERKGLTRRDMAVRTRIPLDQLDYIEEGRLSSLPPVFAKGFLRAYANELSLDAEEILEDYRKMTGGWKNEPAGSLTPKYTEVTVNGVQTSVLKVAAVLVLVIGILAVLYIFVPPVHEFANEHIPFLKTGEPAAAENGPEAAEQTSDGAVAQEEAPAQQIAPAQPQPGAAAAQTAAPAAPETPPVAAPAPGGALTLTAGKKVVVQIVVDGGKPEIVRLSQGQSRTWKAAKDIVVRTENAAATSVVWNGQDLGPLGENRALETTFPK